MKSLILSIFFYVLSLVLVVFDKNFQWRWISFVFSLLALLIPLIFLSFKRYWKGFVKVIQNQTKKERIVLLFFLSFSFIVHFFLLKKYPFLALGDEIRDGGLNARQILNGEIKNIFGYGSYASHGLLIPTLIIPFYLIFGNTVYSYRVPGAMIGFLTSFLVWFFLIILLGKKKKKTSLVFFLGIIFLTSLPWHLYFSRTETVVIFTSFLTVVLLILSLLFLKNLSWENLIPWSLFAGFSFNFHASARATSILVIFFVFTTILVKERRCVFLKILASLLFVLVGFGPRILFSPPAIFFSKHRWATQNSFFAPDLVARYYRSLFIYFKEANWGFVCFSSKIVPFFLQPFFLLGIIGLLFSSLPGKLVVFLLLFIPLVNSAFTEMIGAPHRLASLFPLSVIVYVFGLSMFLSYLSEKRTALVRPIFFFVFAVSVFGTIRIFSKEFFNCRNDPYQILAVNLVKVLKENRITTSKLCIAESNAEDEWLELAHFKEFFDYFLPGTEIKVQQLTEKSDKVIIASKCQNSYDLTQMVLINPFLVEGKILIPE